MEFKRIKKVSIMGIEHQVVYCNIVPGESEKTESLYDGINSKIYITGKSDVDFLRQIIHEVSHARSALCFDSSLSGLLDAALASSDEFVFSELFINLVK